VLCLGSNLAAQLGLSSMTPAPDNNPHPAPAQVAGLPMSAQVTLGRYAGCAVTNVGEYWCWGSNDAFGQTSPGVLGRGTMPMTYAVPGKATLLDASASAGSVGSYFNLALTTGGQIFSWGDNQADELGRNTNGADSPNPAPVTGLSNVTQISAGALTSCAITGGAVHCWGDNAYGQLGRGISGGTSLDATIATALPGNKMASMVSTSGYHVCALATDGSVYCWGRNNGGQCGTNGYDAGSYNPVFVTTPQQIPLPGKALAVGAGGTVIGQTTTGYSCAIIDGGSVYCWGFNGEGELGRSADAGGTIACANNTGLMGGCGPTPGPVIWQ
jgi:alpha-tubulin suppressor-like RCC1 family protein